MGAWRRTPARGDVMNDDESLVSDYEDESLSSEQLEFSPSRIYRNGQAYRQQNRILALREWRDGRPCGGKMSKLLWWT